MTLDERIAKVLGWELNQVDDVSPHAVWWEPWDEVTKQSRRWYTKLPNWSGSLDLMWELEEELDNPDDIGEWEQYKDELYYLCGGALSSIFEVMHATPAQKAEAWLKVKEGRDDKRGV